MPCRRIRPWSSGARAEIKPVPTCGNDDQETSAAESVGEPDAARVARGDDLQDRLSAADQIRSAFMTVVSAQRAPRMVEIFCGRC